MDDEALDLLLERNVPMVPALQFEQASIELGPQWGMSQRVIDGHWETLEAGSESARRVFRAGGRIGLGGDYGFAWTPHGTDAKELTALETLHCATANGAGILGRGHELGTLEAGKLGDVLVVDGDVEPDIALLEDRGRILAVLQGGVVKAGRLSGG